MDPKIDHVARRLDATIAGHPWLAVGLAFALGAVIGARRTPPVPPEAARRSLTSAMIAGVGAIALRLARDFAVRRMAGAARTWFDHRAPSDPSVAPFARR